MLQVEINSLAQKLRTKQTQVKFRKKEARQSCQKSIKTGIPTRFGIHAAVGKVVNPKFYAIFPRM
jgi:hypothetical protein